MMRQQVVQVDERCASRVASSQLGGFTASSYVVVSGEDGRGGVDSGASLARHRRHRQMAAWSGSSTMADARWTAWIA
ncbi:hypothetical protein ACLOJK_006785 [Asimina triloba]